MVLVVLFAALASGVSTALAQTVATWCGKPYEAGSPHITIPAESYFPYPSTSSKPLLNFQCNPVLRPYVSGEDRSASIIVDAAITYDIGKEYTGSSEVVEYLLVAIESEGKILGVGRVKAGTMGTEMSFPLRLLGKATTKPFEITCTAKLGLTTYSSVTPLHYLPPNPSGGTTTKTDLRTGGLLIKPKGGESYEPFLPLGFYTSTSNLTTQESVDDIRAQGCVATSVFSDCHVHYSTTGIDTVCFRPLSYNVIHPVPPFDNAAAQSNAFDYIDKAGMSKLLMN